jgi:hypothetical protein
MEKQKFKEKFLSYCLQNKMNNANSRTLYYREEFLRKALCCCFRLPAGKDKAVDRSTSESSVIGSYGATPYEQIKERRRRTNGAER